MMWRRMDWVKKKRIFRYFLILTKVSGNDEQNIPFSAHSIHTIFSLLIKQFPIKRVDILCPFTFTLSFVLAKKITVDLNTTIEWKFTLCLFPYETIESKWLQFYLITRFMMSLLELLIREFFMKLPFRESWVVKIELKSDELQREFHINDNLSYKGGNVVCRWKMMNRNLINSLTWKTSSIFNSVVSL